jgi:maltose O-acetyltransferase
MKEIKIISKICHLIIDQAKHYKNRKRNEYLNVFGINGENICPNVEFINIQNVKIGSHTYMNSGQLHAGPKSKIIIGDWCAIGYNVHIKSYTHDSLHSTGPNLQMNDKDIIIGNNVWIGDNVYIKEGVKVGDNIIIGANCVVTKDIESNSVVGGVPAKLLYKK